MYLQHLFSVAEDSLKTGSLGISLQTQDKAGTAPAQLLAGLFLCSSAQAGRTLRGNTSGIITVSIC